MRARTALGIVLIFALSIGLCFADTTTVNQDREELLANVRTIVAPGGLPGDIVVLGDNAFTLITGRLGGADLPLFAAARYGAGRVVVGGHEAFLGSAGLSKSDNSVFVRNIAKWLSPGASKPLRVGLIDQSDALAELLKSTGMQVELIRKSTIEAALAHCDQLWINQSSLDGELASTAAVRKWVASKGGMVITGPAWGWQSVNLTKDLTREHSGNRIIEPMGLAFATGELSENKKNGFEATEALSPYSSAKTAMDALESVAPGKSNLTSAQLTQITAVLEQAMSALPSDSKLSQRVRKSCEDKGGNIPTRSAPVTLAMPFARLKAALDSQDYRQLPPEKIRANPSAADFPGQVPASAMRVNRTVHIDSSVPDWHGVGLYAPPGEIITVSIPQSMISVGLSVRIGEHTDTLWNLAKWERFPEISMSRPLKVAATRVASPFGGTLFIEVPEGGKMADFDVTITGAVEAPRFVKGLTTRQDWLGSIRSAPAPWAELQGKLVTLSVPSTAIRDLEDPDALMEYWDSVMQNCYAFFAAPIRPRPERYCVDRQISAGYMHSGYPIMTGEDVARTFCDLAILRGGSGIKCWGFYHEMGHNFQRPEWTWSAFGEVTNNLFSLYGAETLNHVMVGAHPSMTATKIAEREHEIALRPGAEPYYSKDPWYPLTMFWLMRHEFGWEPFTKLFAEFRDLNNRERPRSELAKHDQFLDRFSRLTGRNLSEYLKAWGIEVSDSAVQRASIYPKWSAGRLEIVSYREANFDSRLISR